MTLSVQSQTFKWKELANLNKMTETEQSNWLSEEKNFVLIELDNGFSIYQDTTSSLDEGISIGDSAVVYFWNYQFNPAISTTRGTDYLMSKSLDRNLNKVDAYVEKNTDGKIVSSHLSRVKYGQVMQIGGVFNPSGDHVAEYASAQLFK